MLENLPVLLVLFIAVVLMFDTLAVGFSVTAILSLVLVHAQALVTNAGICAGVPLFLDDVEFLKRSERGFSEKSSTISTFTVPPHHPTFALTD
jgi:hypothetical protein